MKRKKQQNIQPYIVGGLMIILTFSLALVLIYFTATYVAPVKAEVSSQQASGESVLDVTSSSPASDESVLDVTSSSPSSAISSDEPTDVSSNEKITMEFTENEIAQINALITASQNSQVSKTSSTDSSLSPSSDTSSDDMVAIPSNVSIYFEDIESGYVYTSNDDYKYFIASLIKAPYCMYLYTLTEQGKCNLDEIYTIEFKDIQQGTGKIKDKKQEEFPLTMSVRELISYAIRYSDNTSMEALRKHYNHIGYQSYAKSLGLNYPEDVSYIVNGKITAKDAGVYIKAIYNYIETGKYGNELKEDMSHTTNPMIRSKHPVVRKYGWAKLSFHDMAIVCAPHPYLLTILSDKGLGKKEDHQLFAEISKLIESFHAKRYE
ncbi:MAG: serine hydrolase [Oscillospiraceae bacterium]